jgi:transketolase
MGDKKATRQGYGAGLVELAREYKDVVALDADLCGSVGSKDFSKEFPKRHFNVGIAEQNMLGMAAGLARVGYTPFVASFATFCPGRAFEIIRNAICYNNLNVKLVGSHAGITSAADGGTHQAIEDIAIMRALPNMTILDPCDYNQAKLLIKAAYGIKGPVYIRMARIATPVFTDENDAIEIGKVQKLRDGKDVCIIAIGIMNALALEAAEILKKEGVELQLLNLHTIKPLDIKGIREGVKDCGGKLVVVEDCNMYGSVGEAVAYALKDMALKMEHVAIEDKFGQSGSDEELSEAYGLTTKNIVNRVRKLLGRKPQELQ